LRRDSSHGFESGVHGRHVDGSTRPLSDRDSPGYADLRDVDLPTDLENSDLSKNPQSRKAMILIIAISLFFCISLGMLGVYWLLNRPQSAATERMRRLGGSNAKSV